MFVTDFLHVPQGGGGAERNTDELCRVMASCGSYPGVACTLRPDGSLLSWRSRVLRRFGGAEYVRDTVCGYPVYRGWDRARVGDAVRAFRADALVVQSTHPEPLLRALSPFGLPTVVYLHEVEEVDHLGFLADAGLPVIANSLFTAGRLRDRCGLSCEVVRPIVDPDRYLVEGGSRDRVLYVNTMTRKGVEVAFGLAERRPDVCFDFVLSWTHDAEALAALRRRSVAFGNVVLHPPTDDMRRLYAGAKLLLAPSQWEEAWGRVATEAHVNGIPVLGSDRGGLPEAIGPGGIVLPADSSMEEWALAFGRLWDDPVAYAGVSDAARRYSARPEIRPSVIAGDLFRILGGAL